MNNITNNLPQSLDHFLMDLAQTSEYVNIDYTDVSKFAEKATKDEVNRLRKLKTLYEDLEDDEDSIELIKDCGSKIERLIKRS